MNYRMLIGWLTALMLVVGLFAVAGVYTGAFTNSLSFDKALFLAGAPLAVVLLFSLCLAMLLESLMPVKELLRLRSLSILVTYFAFVFLGVQVLVFSTYAAVAFFGLFQLYNQLPSGEREVTPTQEKQESEPEPLVSEEAQKRRSEWPSNQEGSPRVRTIPVPKVEKIDWKPSFEGVPTYEEFRADLDKV